MADPAARVTFRPLAVADLPVLHAWLHRPHVAEWWDGLPSLADVEADYLPAIHGRDSTRAFVALADGAAIGFIQAYVVMDAGGDWWPHETDPGARGIDQFLADAASLGRGLGTAMVRAFVDGLFADPAVTRVQTDPDPRNARAIRCYEKAGFSRVGEVDTPDGRALLMVRESESRRT